MHALTPQTTRAVFCFWITLFAMVVLAAASPVPEPEPAPIDPKLASALGQTLNLGCQNGCAGAASAHQLDTNAALGSSASPLVVLGGIAIASSMLAVI